MAQYYVNVNDVVEVKVANSLFDQYGINVLHARVQGLTLTSVNLPEIAAAIAPGIATIYKPTICRQAFHYGVQVGVLRVTPTPLPAVDITQTGACTGGVDPLPGQDSGLVSMRTDQGGRRGRGRIYVPFPATDTLTGTTVRITAGYKTLLTGIGTFFTGPITITGVSGTATLVWGVYGRNSVAAPPMIDFAFSRPSEFLATQRRRAELNRPDTVPFV